MAQGMTKQTEKSMLNEVQLYRVAKHLKIGDLERGRDIIRLHSGMAQRILSCHQNDGCRLSA